MAPPGMAPPGTAPRKSPLKWILLGCGGFLALGAIFVVLLVTFVLKATQPAVDAGDAFLGDLRRGDYAAANARAVPALQKDVGGTAGLEKIVVSGHARPKSWSFSSRNVNGSTAHLAGTATFTDGAEGPVSLDFEEVGGSWKLTRFRLR